MNPDLKTEEDVTPEANTRAETERLEREERRKEREAECAVINAIVDKSNALIDRMNALGAERIGLRHTYSEASAHFQYACSGSGNPSLRSSLLEEVLGLNTRLLEIDREHWACSKEFAILEAEYVALSKAYDEKWAPAWGGLLGVTTMMGAAISKLIGGYLTTTAAKKTP